MIPCPLLEDAHIASIRAEAIEQGAKPQALKIFDEACSELPRQALSKILKRHNATEGSGLEVGPAKYLDIPRQVMRNARIAVRLSLHKKSGLKLLDLGMGSGMLCFVAKVLGHDAQGLDIKLDLYEDICAALGVKRTEHRIERNTPIPDLGAPFDVVTAVSLMFHFKECGNGVRRYWTGEDWNAFFREIALLIRSDATVYLALNPMRTPDGSTITHSALLDSWQHYGGEVIDPGKTVIFRNGLTRDSLGLSLPR